MTEPVLYLMCGLPGSGKSSRAREIASGENHVLLNADEWVWHLYPDDAEAAARDDRKHLVEQLQWQVAMQHIANNTNVVLDWGVWSRRERDLYRRLTEQAGARFVLIYLEASIETLHRRIARRNLDLPPGCFHIAASELDEWAEMFQPPTADELRICR